MPLTEPAAPDRALRRDTAETPTLATPASAAALAADARRRVVGRAMLIGLWVWPSFTLLDAWMSFVAYPGAPFATFLLYRVVVESFFVATYLASRRKESSVERLVLGQNIAFAATATAIALMAMELGGVRSPYMHGISIVALVRAVLIPERWRHAWPHFAVIGLIFPVVMAAGAIVSPEAQAEWLARDALIVFVSNYVFVLSTAVLGLIGSNLVWQAQEQLYRARRVGRYRLQAPIGKGGMGEVWLAWDLSLQRNVALKLLRVSGNSGPDAVARFELEALAASRLQSPHVIQIFDYGASEDGLYYIAMEYLDGSDLQTLVERQGPLDPSTAIRYMLQACLALDVAHQAGVIHRDIKPHNLFLCRGDDATGLIKLLDFGIVRLREPTARHITWTGMVVGTPVYVAPEIWRGQSADERSDLYALGVTLRFLLTGEAPRLGGPLSEPGTAEPRGDWLPEPLESILTRCLAPDPAKRMQSARELYQELDRVLAAGPLATP